MRGHQLLQSAGRLGLSFESPGRSLITLAVLVISLLLTTIVWRRFFSPLKTVPGPFWASVTRLWHVKIIIDGDQNEQLRDAHVKYGPFVRIAPNEVSVSHSEGVGKILLQNLPKVSQGSDLLVCKY